MNRRLSSSTRSKSTKGGDYDIYESDHSRLPSGPEHLSRRAGLLPGDQLVRVFPRRAALPKPRPRALAPDRACPHEAEPTLVRQLAALRGNLRPDHSLSQG